MEEKKLFNFFPFVNNIFFWCFLIVVALWIVGHLISYWYYGEVTKTDLVGSTFAAILFTYFIHLLVIFKNPPSDS